MDRVRVGNRLGQELCYDTSLGSRSAAVANLPKCMADWVSGEELGSSPLRPKEPCSFAFLGALMQEREAMGLREREPSTRFQGGGGEDGASRHGRQ